MAFFKFGTKLLIKVAAVCKHCKKISAAFFLQPNLNLRNSIDQITKLTKVYFQIIALTDFSKTETFNNMRLLSLFVSKLFWTSTSIASFSTRSRLKMVNLTSTEVDSIIDFWFLPKDNPGYGKQRSEWFMKNEDFDNEIRAKFGPLVEKAIAAELVTDDNDPTSSLAHIILLDQFTRNLFRGDKKSYQADNIASLLSRSLVSNGKDMSLPPHMRIFVYMPLMHSESVEHQNQCVELMKKLYEETNEFKHFLDYAIQHQGVVVKYGRFPHRNVIVGRESTEAELAYLALPGAGV